MTARRAPRRQPPWARWSDEQLLDLRLSDLDVSIEGSWLERPVARLQQELDNRGLRLRPHTWLGEEWFCPDGVAGFAVPFFLAHPRLMKLEYDQMLEVEGGNLDWCLKIMRHETGHAIRHAFGLHRRRRWQQLFGRATQKYPDYYQPRPASKRYVLHLYLWYAQSHPDEDFAETFAVWLRPGSGWRRRYAGWPALKKLEYVDGLMAELAGQRPRKLDRERVRPVSKLHTTLREYYQAKRARYGAGFSDVYDRDLETLFSNDPRHRNRQTASAFLRQHRREIRDMVSRWTGEYEFTLDQVMREMTGRARELKLRVVGNTSRVKLDFAILLTVRTMQYLYTSREWHPL